jgi:hypothetical protein
MAKNDTPFGGLVRFLANPCLPSFQILAEAAEPAALKLFYSLLPFDKKSAIKILTGKSWLCHAKGIAQELTMVEPEEESLGLKFAFTLNEIVDEASWYIYLADVTTNFLANWTTQVLRMTNCKPDPRVKYGSTRDVEGFPTSNGTYQGFENAFGMYPDWPAGQPDGWMLEPGDEFTTTFSITLIPPGGGPGVVPTSVKLIDTDTGQIYASGINDPIGGPGKESAFAWGKVINTSPSAIKNLGWQFFVPYYSPITIVDIKSAYLSIRWFRPGGW